MIFTTDKSVLSSQLNYFILGTNSWYLPQLKELLPDFDSAMFFAKLYGFKFEDLIDFIAVLFQSHVLEELIQGDHSIELQDYIVQTIPFDFKEGITYHYQPVEDSFLASLYEFAGIEIADSIQEVADKLKDTVNLLPSNEGQMIFNTMRTMNANRPTLGSYKARIQHPHNDKNLVILDVSGSMSQSTIQTIVEDVTGLAYRANAAMCIVSNTATYWEPGHYSVEAILYAAEFGGTHYEELIPVLNQNWNTVITIADYDSSPSAKAAIRKHAYGSIEKVFDISLVNRPTYLSECVGQHAKEIKPLLIAQKSLV